MAIYTISVLGESSISITGGVGLDGVTQGDGSHLVGETLTINVANPTDVVIDDGGSETFFADNDGTQRLDGAQTIDGVTYADNTQIEAEYRFILRDDATMIEYEAIAVNLANSSPVYGTVEGLSFVDQAPPVGVPLTILSASEGPPNSGTTAVEPTDIVPICLCAGTLIATRQGQRAIETLQVGDDILRRDGTYVRLRRVFRTQIDGHQLMRNEKLRPVLITAGALGKGLPYRDVLMSRQHRMLISSKIAERMFGTAEVLIPAIKLTPLPGIAVDNKLSQVVYFHLLFDAHEVIFAEGALTESLFTGPEALKALPSEARAELLTLFPQIAEAGYRPRAAAFIPENKHQKALIHRHLAKRRPVWQ